MRLFMKVLLRHIMVAPNLYKERRESFRPDSTAEEGREGQLKYTENKGTSFLRDKSLMY